MSRFFIYIRNYLFLCGILLVAIPNAEAQQGFVPNGGTYNRWSVWNEIYLLGKIKGKWSYQMEFHYRRQGDASWVPNDNHLNPVKNAYQHLYRPWLHWLPKSFLRLSISPAAYTASWTPSAESSSGIRFYQPEWRTSLQAMIIHRKGRVQFNHRFRYEYRWFGYKENDSGRSEIDYDEGNQFPFYSNDAPNGTHALQKNRMRYMFRCIVPLGKHQQLDKGTWYLIAWNELYTAFGKNVSKYEWIDQNRFFFLLGYKLKTDVPIRLELGYGLRTVPRFTVKNDVVTYKAIEQNNIIQLYVWFDDFNAFFKKKTKEASE